MANANIFAQYMRPVKSVQEYAADYDAQESNQLALSAKRMQMQQAQRGIADDEAVRGIVRQYGSDKNALAKALYGGGYATQAQGVEKSIAEEQAAALGRREKEGAIAKQEREAADASYNAYEMARSRFLSDPAISKQKVVGALNEMAAFGKLPARLVEQLTANLPDDPNELRADIERGDLSRLSPEKRLELFAPKWDMKNTGQKMVPVQSNPRAPGFNANQPLQMEATPGEVMTDTRTRAEGAANRGVQYAGQRIQRDRLEFDKGTAVAEAGGPNQAALAKQFGKAEPGRRWRPDGSQEPIPGGSQDPKNNSGAVAKVTDAQDVLSLLDQAEPLLDKSTNSYTGAAIDEVGRAFGGATGGARAAAQLRALEGALIAKMPKMSGPQSDKDVLLYKQMAGQIGDRTIPAEQKRAAMQTIREINNRHAGTVPKPAGALSPEDAQAREWATKNPNDPRAKQIMQRLGGG